MRRSRLDLEPRPSARLTEGEPPSALRATSPEKGEASRKGKQSVHCLPRGSTWLPLWERCRPLQQAGTEGVSPRPPPTRNRSTNPNQPFLRRQESTSKCDRRKTRTPPPQSTIAAKETRQAASERPRGFLPAQEWERGCRNDGTGAGRTEGERVRRKGEGEVPHQVRNDRNCGTTEGMAAALRLASPFQGEVPRQRRWGFPDEEPAACLRRAMAGGAVPQPVRNDGGRCRTMEATGPAAAPS